MQPQPQSDGSRAGGAVPLRAAEISSVRLRLCSRPLCSGGWRWLTGSWTAHLHHTHLQEHTHPFRIVTTLQHSANRADDAGVSQPSIKLHAGYMQCVHAVLRLCAVRAVCWGAPQDGRLRALRGCSQISSAPR